MNTERYTQHHEWAERATLAYQIITMEVWLGLLALLLFV